MKMTKLMLSAAVAAVVAHGAFASPAGMMKLKMAEMIVKTAEKNCERFGSGTMAKQSTREARERVNGLLQTSADDPAVVALDERVKKLEGKFDAEAKEREEAHKAFEANKAAEKKAADDAAAAKASLGASLAHKAPLPWPMEKEDRDRIAKYVEELGQISNSKLVGELKDALEARAAEDRKIVEAKVDGWEKAQEELSLYNLFLDQLGHRTVVFDFTGDVDLETKMVNFKQVSIRTYNSTIYVRPAEDKKVYFYEANKARCFVEGKEMDAVNEALRRFFYVNYFLKDSEDKDFQKNAMAAGVIFGYIKQAVANNSPDKIEYAPMPKKGALHEQFAKEALQTITTQSDNYKDVYEVIIDADNWQVESKFGGIERRKFGGWGLKKYKYGIRAFRVQWCQDYLGGGKYAPLRLYATAGGHMYVK